MINIFSTYVAPQIKEIHHPELLQEWKLNIDAAEYENNMNANMYKPSEKKRIHRVDSNEHWPTSIKETIQWFPFIAIMEHTANKMKNNNGLISSVLKIFAVFQICLSYEDKKLDVVSIKCINCKRETYLNSETSFSWIYDEIITKFVLNAILHHVGMS